MTPNPKPSAPTLREALYALSLAKAIPDARSLDDVVRQYPQFAEDLTDFAIELALDALRVETTTDAAETVVDPSNVSPVVSRAMSRFHNRLHAVRQAADFEPTGLAPPSDPVENPFTKLSRQEFRDFAERIGANTVFVAKLRDRQIEPETMTDSFKQFVADELKAPLDVLVTHFEAAGNSVAANRQFYKSDDKPNHDKRQSFAEAVKSSGLTVEQQRRLMSL